MSRKSRQSEKAAVAPAAPASTPAPKAERLLPISEVAAKYGVSEQTVRRWAIKGVIHYKIVGPYRMKRIPQSEVDRLIQDAPANAR